MAPTRSTPSPPPKKPGKKYRSTEIRRACGSKNVEFKIHRKFFTLLTASVSASTQDKNLIFLKFNYSLKVLFKSSAQCASLYCHGQPSRKDSQREQKKFAEFHHAMLVN